MSRKNASKLNAKLSRAAAVAVATDPESPATEMLLMLNAGAGIPDPTPGEIANAATETPAATETETPAAPPARPSIRYGMLHLMRSVAPYVLIPIGANHRNTSKPGIPSRYVYADSNGTPIPPGDARLPSHLDSLNLALHMCAVAATLTERTDSTDDPAIVDSCGVRYGNSPRHATTHAAMRLDAHDFASSFTARVLESIPRGMIHASCHAAMSRLPGARSNHDDASARLEFVRVLAVNVRSTLLDSPPTAP
jgi:hypothetical protein